MDSDLPADLQTALGQFIGMDSVVTLQEWTTEIRRLTGGGAIASDDLCHTAEETPHWGELGDERYHFRCFYDAVILAALTDQPVHIHTISPNGTVIEASAIGTETLSVIPDGAVFSIGIEYDAHERFSGTPTLRDGYTALCPYVKAFPDRDAYETWADDVPAATVAMPLESATAVASALVA